MQLKSLTQMTVFFVLTYSVSAGTIYGKDDRKELYQIRDPSWVEIAKSVPAMFYLSDLRFDSNSRMYGFAIDKRVKDLHNFCSNEKFLDEPQQAHCSAALVGDDKVLTAGHCVVHEPCENLVFVFNFTKKDNYSPVSLSSEDVFNCKKIIDYKFSYESKSQDWAIVQLDRKVDKYKPLVMDQAHIYALGEKIGAIGYPLGTPLKAALHGKIIEGAWSFTLPEHQFFASIDVYQGNSGSPVFDLNSKKIIGLVVQAPGGTLGMNPFDYNEKKKCLSAYHCKNHGCDGLDVAVTKATYIPALNP